MKFTWLSWDDIFYLHSDSVMLCKSNQPSKVVLVNCTWSELYLFSQGINLCYWNPEILHSFCYLFLGHLTGGWLHHQLPFLHNKHDNEPLNKTMMVQCPRIEKVMSCKTLMFFNNGMEHIICIKHAEATQITQIF